MVLRLFVFLLLIGSMVGISFVKEIYATHSSGIDMSEAALVFLQVTEALMPLVTGFLIDLFGVTTIIVVLPAFSFISSLIAYLLKGTSSEEMAEAVHTATHILYANSA